MASFSYDYVLGPLAYLTAMTHGLTEEAEAIKQSLGQEDLVSLQCTALMYQLFTVIFQSIATHPRAKLLQPPPPILQSDQNWPLLTTTRSFFEQSATVRSSGGPKLVADFEAVTKIEGQWEDDEEVVLDEGRHCSVME